jgi:hypothetical protein
MTKFLDVLDLRLYTREQLIQLLDLFYGLLQERTVTVNTQVLPTYQNHQPVVNPLPNTFAPLINGTGDTLMDYHKITCNAKSSLV